MSSPCGDDEEYAGSSFKKSSRKNQNESKEKRRSATDKSQGWEVETQEKDIFSNSTRRKRNWENIDEEDTTEISTLVPNLQTEEGRQQDLKERDEFAARLHERDKERTEKVTEKRGSREAEKEALSRREIFSNAELMKSKFPDIRERSRQEYLSKREEQRLLLLEKKIYDEEFLFGRDESLTLQEKNALERDKTILNLVRERMKLSGNFEGYQIPEDYITDKGKLDKTRIDSLLSRTNQDKGGQGSFVTEQVLWEQHQIDRIIGKSSQKESSQQGEFDYIFDESQSIKFIKQAELLEELDKENSKDRKPELTPGKLKLLSIKKVRESLPVYAYREEFVKALETYQIIIMVGETGSGKTTQIPQYLHDAGYTKNGAKIGITQPRRVAAMSVAARVAEEMNTKIGYEVGYSIRFEDCTSDKTVLKYMTDGMLLREFLTDPDLSSYSVIMIDEAHERTLHTDILFGLVKDIARYRKDLRVLVSSATMDAEKFSEYFDDAPIFHIPGRRFPVEIYYTASPEANYIQAALTTILTIHISQPPGDILLFLTGQEEIEQAEEALKTITNSIGSKIPELIVVPCYANLPSELQVKIFEHAPEGTRKIVLATNIAETSITIDGIVYVIDPGFEKQNNYNPKTRMESLVVVPCSRASAKQRAGRAGRLSPGKCFRLYTSWAYKNELEESTVPEIQRANMANVVLLLKSLGISDLMNFDFIDAPPAETLIRALEQLYSLGAINSHGELTKLGRCMAEFPMDPMLSKIIITSEKYSCSDEILSIVSMLSVAGSLFYRPKNEKVAAEQQRKNFFRPGGDHLTLLTVWNSWVETGYSVQWCYENYIQHRSMKRARDLRDQLASLAERTEVKIISNPDPSDTVPIRKAIASGFFFNIARAQKGTDTYKTVKTNQTVMIHPSSSLYQEHTPWILYHELVYTSREFVRQCTEINPEWILELAPHYYNKKELEYSKNRVHPHFLPELSARNRT